MVRKSPRSLEALTASARSGLTFVVPSLKIEQCDDSFHIVGANGQFTPRAVTRLIAFTARIELSHSGGVSS